MSAGTVPASAFGTKELRRSRSHLITSIVVLVIATLAIVAVALNPRFQWDVVLQYLTWPTVLSGVLMTLWLTVVVVALGLIGGVLIALCRESPLRILSWLAWAFTWFFRSVPMLVQLLFWYNLAALFPRFQLGIPGLEPWMDIDTNTLITPLAAVIIGFALHEAAYMSEIVRSGLSAVPRGQWLAGRSLGMTERLLFRKVVLPQVMRVIVPTMGNEAISVMKMTSLVSVIAVTDLLYSVQLIYGINFKTIPLLLVASIWYLLLTIVLGLAQNVLEKYYGRGIKSPTAQGRDA